MKEHSYRLYALIILMIQISIHASKAQYTIPPRMEWWYEARFGMFIHFGSYSYLGHGEWAFSEENWTKSAYQTQVSANFNPSDFNAGTIARLAKNAGMKYLVITAKHHEGFCMWETDVQSFKDITGTTMYDLPDYTAFGTRDILQELKDSCEAQDIKFCLYYSILDWNHSSQEINRHTYYSNMASESARTDYIADMKVQLNELITRYHPAVMWFDGDWTYNAGSPTLSSWWTKSDGEDLYNYLRSLDTAVIINERVCRSFSLGDFDCPEKEVPDTPLNRPWETCQTMNNSWGYKIWDQNYKTPATLIREMVKVVSRDGNYLLNIGPKGDGTVPEQSVKVLNQIGEWMAVNSESIYAATRSPFASEPVWGYYTKKPGKLFAHVFEWPDNGILKIPSLVNSIKKIYTLTETTTSISFADSNGYIRLSLPDTAPDPMNTVFVLDVSGIPEASSEFIKVTDIVITGENGAKTIDTYGGSLQLSATAYPLDATDNTVSWTVSDTNVACIDAEGLLTAKQDGTITVTAVANDESDIRGRLRITISNQTTGDQQFRDQTTVRIFPNPNEHGILNIIQTGKPKSELVIYDIYGCPVMKHVISEKSFSFDISSLSTGFYTIRISDDASVFIHKLIKS
ncbi:MAG: alpha-L-fucosidase [Bacteroidales bacterium]|nr:alpha-L-fucosidase [Bacteroidales bacterium]